MPAGVPLSSEGEELPSTGRVALIIQGLSPSGFLLAEEEERGSDEQQQQMQDGFMAGRGRQGRDWGDALKAAGRGRQWELTPDGNSLDMMTGLIRRKIG